MDNDIEEMEHELKVIKQEAQSPFILDINSPQEKIMETLSKLHKQSDEMQKKAHQYRTYQKNFKLEVAKFETLEEVSAELKLKLTLWEAMSEFDVVKQEWTDAPLTTLDMETMNTTVVKYGKTVYQLEKGLPPNNAVPKLRQKLEEMKDKLPVLQNLRNPNLKTRHWESIQHILNFQFTEAEPVTLGRLVELSAFTFGEQIMEVSGQASSEASLEALLRKVEDAWKNAEFLVMPHKDSKDVYILGIIDDIQQLWDDSNINIQTINSSRHVGPIKPRVEDWARQLELFGKTLDAWLVCQRNWLYLESIFSAPDIARQLPAEAKMFFNVDKTYKDIMRKVYKVPAAMRAATQPGLLERFQQNNALLDQILKCLEAYLESKRVIFPRFYFLSNDELLEILAQTRNPLAVQPHLRKCFDAIVKLDFAGMNAIENKTEEDETEEGAGPKVVNLGNILAMFSPEGERVELGKGLKAKGNVEEWLGKVEEAMFVSLRRITKYALNDYQQKEREVWLTEHPSQVVLTVNCLMWCRDVTAVLTAPPEEVEEKLKAFEQKSFTDLNKLAALVRTDLPKLVRLTLSSLITIDVHSRDIISELVAKDVRFEQAFDWQKQQRYYWDLDIDNCAVRMSNAMYVYGYEYLGAAPRLVITPLTDRCYLCLMGALQLDLGGAPASPAGTGKTETTKDLAKSIARQCVVFNCSDGLDYKMMGKFFSGLAQSGAWCCFDEFNRIDIEVLSVIAQQLITIRNAKAAKLHRFMFEGREIKLLPTCSVFITMNPGYAGRTELPDNLKALFRPIAMMVPDYKLIAEVILYSEGFETSKPLSQKMVQMYKLCSEQLSQQDHYDFGMRAVKSVLVMAGSLKRQNPDKHEDVVLIRALRDSNLPKFLKQDAVLFKAILQDLFPGVELPEHDYGRLLLEIQSVTAARGLQVVEPQFRKVIELYETMIVRHGVMLVGPTGGGKTVCYEILAQTLTNLHKAKIPHPFYQPVHTFVMNPKSVTMGELYGDYDKLTMEWHDGLMALIVRGCVNDTTEDHQWIVCDGPVDALWIENMNSVLDDNKLLCLANSERIKLTNFIHMMFEVQDLAVASPATVSRCGMVYIDPAELGFMPYVRTWAKKHLERKVRPETYEYILQLFERYVQNGINFVKKKCQEMIPAVELSKATTICKLMESLLLQKDGPDLKLEESRLNPMICTTFAFCYLWAVGGNISENNWDAFEAFIRGQFEDNPDAKLPTTGDLWSYFMDFHTRRMDMWERRVTPFQYNKEVPYFEMLVPTVDTVRFGFLLEKLLLVSQPVLFTGNTGVGKSVIARDVLNRSITELNFVPVFINFSAQTSSKRTQEMLEGKLEKRKKNVIGAPIGKRTIIFVDDLNMPKLDTYGSQPPIELLRQMVDFGGTYDRLTMIWKDIQDVTLAAACAPPGGGRNPVTPRFLRHFSIMNVPAASDYVLKHMFTSILNGFLTEFQPTVRQNAENVVSAAVEIYARMSTDLLPTPAKSHYVFNLRDLSKCVQGIL